MPSMLKLAPCHDGEPSTNGPALTSSGSGAFERLSFQLQLLDVVFLGFLDLKSVAQEQN